MPISYREFLDSAVELEKKAKKEVDWRNVASRSYYAAFHSCRYYRRHYPPLDKKAGGNHSQLIDQMGRFSTGTALQVGAVQEAAILLSQHRDMRTHADYDISLKFASQHARQSIKQAQAVIDKINEAFTSKVASS